MDMAPFKLDIDDPIADYAKVNFIKKKLCYVCIVIYLSLVIKNSSSLMAVCGCVHTEIG